MSKTFFNLRLRFTGNGELDIKKRKSTELCQF
jgi:hypothetical protein